MTCIYDTNVSLFPFGREPRSACKQHSVSEIVREKSMWDVKKEDLFLIVFILNMFLIRLYCKAISRAIQNWDKYWVKIDQISIYRSRAETEWMNDYDDYH